MRTSSRLALAILLLPCVARADGGGGASPPAVSLQSSSPGTADVGNANLNGAIIAGGTISGSGIASTGSASILPTAYATGSLPATCTNGTIVTDTTALVDKQCFSNAWIALGPSTITLGTPSWLAVSGSPLTGTGTLTLSGATGLTTHQVLGTGSSGSIALLSLTAADLPSIPAATQLTGLVPIANGGTNGTATATAGGIAYGTGSAFGFTAAGSTNNCLLSNGTSAPTWGSCSTGSGTVTTLSMPSDFSVANPTTTPAVTYAATQTAGGVVYGTGSARAVSAAGSSGNCLVSNGSSAPSWGSCSTGSGTVTSFSVTSVPSDMSASVANSTTTPALTISYNTESANTVLAGPTTGSAATPSYRSLVAADIPGLAASAITSGTVAVAQGGTNTNSTTQGGVLYGASSTADATTSAGVNGQFQVLGSNGSSAPTWGPSTPDLIAGPRLFYYTVITPASTGLTGTIVGGSPTALGTAANAVNSTRNAVHGTSGAVSGNEGGFWSNQTITEVRWLPWFKMIARSGTDIGGTLSRKSWFGLGNNDMGAQSTDCLNGATSSVQGAWICLNIANSTSFQCCTSDGSGASGLSCTSTGVVAATSTDYLMTVDLRTNGSGGVPICIINGTSTTAANSKLPAGTTALNWMAESVTTSANAIISFDVSAVEVVSN
jgi:hypothetical protein